MSSQPCFGDTQTSSLAKPFDILNLLRDENFPKLPSFVPPQNKKDSIQTQSRIQIPNDFCEDAYESPAFRTPKKPSKKKGVVFSQELEQHCSVSPKKMDLEEIRVNLNKRAKKSILVRKGGLLSSSNVSDSTKPSLSIIQGILSLSSVASLAFDSDAPKEPSRSVTKSSTPSHNQQLMQYEKKNKDGITPGSMEIMALDASDASSISIEDEDRIVENKIENNNDKIITHKPSNPVKREAITTSNSGNLRTFQSQLKAQLSFSAMVAPIEPPQLKKNQSAIMDSGNDFSSIQGNTMTSKAASKILGPNAKIPSEFENTRRRLVLSKSARGTLVQGSSNPPAQRDSYQRDSYKGENTQKPIPKPLKIPLVETIQKTIPLSNSDVRKIQTPSNNRMVIKTTNLPSTPSSHQFRAKIVALHDKTQQEGESQNTNAHTNFSLSCRETSNSNTTSSGSSQDLSHKRISSDTFYVKNGNQIICYSLKEGQYKTFESEQSLFLDGSAFCKANNDMIIVTGGADSQSKLVSSKATLINMVTNDKEALPGMPIARYNHGVTLHNGKNLYTIGGQSFEGKVLKSCYMLELGSKNWSRIPSLKYERANPIIFTSSKTGNLYVIGGTDSEGNEVPWVEKLDIQKQAWQLVYNATKFDLCSKDMIVLGSFNNGKSEETLILVKDSISKNGGGKYLLFSFDTENEVLSKKGDFQYETSNSVAFGFVNGNNIYFTEKSRLNMFDVYILDSQIWAHKRLKQVS